MVQSRTLIILIAVQTLSSVACLYSHSRSSCNVPQEASLTFTVFSKLAQQFSRFSYTSFSIPLYFELCVLKPVLRTNLAAVQVWKSPLTSEPEAWISFSRLDQRCDYGASQRRQRPSIGKLGEVERAEENGSIKMHDRTRDARGRRRPRSVCHTPHPQGNIYRSQPLSCRYKQTRNCLISASRPGTFRTVRVDLLGPHAPIAVTENPNPARRQHQFPHVAMGSPTPSQSRGFALHSILNPAPETFQKSTARRGQAPARTIGQYLVPPQPASPGSRKRAEPVPLTRDQQLPLAGQRLSNENTPVQETGCLPQPSTGDELRISTADSRIDKIRPPVSIKGNAPRRDLPSNERPPLGSAEHSAGVFWIATAQSPGPSPSRTSQSWTEGNSAAFGRCTAPAALKPQYGYRQHHLASHPENHKIEQPTHRMALETDRGSRILPVELNLQQASKSADAKRKQADASARFRARRRDVVREASEFITILQQEVRDLREARDFYRNERNYIRDFTSRQTRTSIPPRPRSPLSHLLTANPAQASNVPERMENERGRSDSAHRPHDGERLVTLKSPLGNPYGTAYAPTPRAPLPLPLSPPPGAPRLHPPHRG